MAAPRFGASFGVMQGRLSEQTDLGYQAFPWAEWENEFERASARQLQHIEWVLDSWRWEDNPLVSRPDEVQSLTQTTGVAVRSVCADYLMNTPLKVADSEAWSRLDRLLGSMQHVGATYLVIPFVDQSSFERSPAGAAFLGSVSKLEERVSQVGVTVALETDLGAAAFADILGHLDPSVFGVNYDIGNSAALGYDPAEELAAYGDRVVVLHIKDRLRGAGSVPLGTGDADIPLVLKAMAAKAFDGITTMQAFRDHEGLTMLDEQLSDVADMLDDVRRQTR